MKRYRIAAIPGDGIGKEIIPEGSKVLQAMTALEKFDLEIETFPWSAEHYNGNG